MVSGERGSVDDGGIVMRVVLRWWSVNDDELWCMARGNVV